MKKHNVCEIVAVHPLDRAGKECIAPTHPAAKTERKPRNFSAPTCLAPVDVLVGHHHADHPAMQAERPIADTEVHEEAVCVVDLFRVDERVEVLRLQKLRGPFLLLLVLATTKLSEATAAIASQAAAPLLLAAAPRVRVTTERFALEAAGIFAAPFVLALFFIRPHVEHAVVEVGPEPLQTVSASEASEVHTSAYTDVWEGYTYTCAVLAGGTARRWTHATTGRLGPRHGAMGAAALTCPRSIWCTLRSRGKGFGTCLWSCHPRAECPGLPL